MSDIRDTDEDIIRQMDPGCDCPGCIHLREIQEYRAIKLRLEELALSLEHGHHPDQRKLGAELRRRMEGK